MQNDQQQTDNISRIMQLAINDIATGRNLSMWEQDIKATIQDMEVRAITDPFPCHDALLTSLHYMLDLIKNKRGIVMLSIPVKEVRETARQIIDTVDLDFLLRIHDNMQQVVENYADIIVKEAEGDERKLIVGAIYIAALQQAVRAKQGETILSEIQDL